MEKCGNAVGPGFSPKSGTADTDEPFEGLDQDSLESFSRSYPLLFRREPLILITHRFNELVPEISHILCLKNGKLFAQGKREAMLKIAHNGSLYGADLKLLPFGKS